MRQRLRLGPSRATAAGAATALQASLGFDQLATAASLEGTTDSAGSGMVRATVEFASSPSYVSFIFKFKNYTVQIVPRYLI